MNGGRRGQLAGSAAPSNTLKLGPFPQHKTLFAQNQDSLTRETAHRVQVPSPASLHKQHKLTMSLRWALVR